jgi:hypothetical protein
MKYDSWIKEGRVLIVDTIKIILYKKAPDLFELLDFEDDKAFTEPLLFAFFNSKEQNNHSLEQILWGYIGRDRRPNKILVKSDTNGLVYLPAFGYLETKNANMTLFLHFLSNQIHLTDNDEKAVAFDYLNLKKVDFFHINSSQPALLEPFFLSEEGKKVEVELVNQDRNIESLERAIKIIERVNPEYYNHLKEVVRGVYLYKGDPNSFATLSAHGLAFFNIQFGNELVFFIDNIVHQCGHVIFNTISFEKEKWFSVSPSTLLIKFTRDSSDKADIYGRFHGLFTQTNVNKTLDAIVDSKLLEGKELHELLGRFTSNMNRFGLAIGKLDRGEVYTDLGKEWLNHFKQTYKYLLDKRKSLIDSFKVDNQPYVFSYEIFNKSNPIELIKNFE